MKLSFTPLVSARGSVTHLFKREHEGQKVASKAPKTLCELSWEKRERLRVAQGVSKASLCPDCLDKAGNMFKWGMISN